VGLQSRYDRAAHYEQVWSQAVQDVAKSYGIFGVRLEGRLPIPLKSAETMF